MYNIHALQSFEAGMYAGAIPELIYHYIITLSLYHYNNHLESLLQKTSSLNLKFSVNSVL